MLAYSVVMRRWTLTISALVLLTAVKLIRLAIALVPLPSTAMLIAVSASFEIPCVISTLPNAIAFGEGGVESGGLFSTGFALMVIDRLIVSLAGQAVLNPVEIS